MELDGNPGRTGLLQCHKVFELKFVFILAYPSGKGLYNKKGRYTIAAAF